MRFLRNGPVRHRTGREPLTNVLRRLDFIERNRLRGGLQVEQAAEREELLLLPVDPFAESLEFFMAVEPRRQLEPRDRLGVEEMRFTFATPLILAADVELDHLRDF